MKSQVTDTRYLLDHRGTIHRRHISAATVIKTGTLHDVSSLAGVMPTGDRSLVWFAILNRGTNPAGFRSEQDKQRISSPCDSWLIDSEFSSF